jgi:hypothetical protein
MIVSSRRIILPIMATAGALALMMPRDAAARCNCLCVDGEVKAVCESGLDVEPICGPRLCPIDSPAIEPIARPRLPPVGTTTCRWARVAIQRSYEWHTICE